MWFCLAQVFVDRNDKNYLQLQCSVESRCTVHENKCYMSDYQSFSLSQSIRIQDCVDKTQFLIRDENICFQIFETWMFF